MFNFGKDGGFNFWFRKTAIKVYKSKHTTSIPPLYGWYRSFCFVLQLGIDVVYQFRITFGQQYPWSELNGTRQRYRQGTANGTNQST